MTARLGLELRPEGLYVPAIDLFLDPTAKVPRAFVSHAHLAGSGAHVFASQETLALLARPKDAGTTLLEWEGAIEVPIAGGHARLSLAPAGHMLGAAQLVVDHPGGRFVYTGDTCTASGATYAAATSVGCDELCIESTYALPIFRFPDRAATMQSLVDSSRRHLDEGRCVVVFAHALGAAQEVIHHLVAAKLSTAAYGAAWRACEAYEALGVPFGTKEGALRELSDSKGDGRPFVVVASPGARAALKTVRGLTARSAGTRVVLVSGAAILEAAVEQRRADQGFPISMHDAYDDLLTTVHRSGARHVTTTHGDASTFAAMLRATGIAATGLERGPLDDEDA